MIMTLLIGFLINALFILGFRVLVHNWTKKDEINLIAVFIFLFVLIFYNFLWMLTFIFGSDYWLDSYTYLLDLAFFAPPVVLFCYGVESVLLHGKGLGNAWSKSASLEQRMTAFRGWVWVMITCGMSLFLLLNFGAMGLGYFLLFLVLMVGKELFLREKPQESEPK